MKLEIGENDLIERGLPYLLEMGFAISREIGCHTCRWWNDIADGFDVCIICSIGNDLQGWTPIRKEVPDER